mgnify:CR=1 FL=1
MWTVISVCLIVIVSMVGVTEILRTIWLYLMRPKEDPPKIMVVFLKESIAIQQLNSAMEQLTWEGLRSFNLIAGIDCGLSDKTKKAVIKRMASCPQMVFGTAALLDNIKAIKEETINSEYED